MRDCRNAFFAALKLPVARPRLETGVPQAGSALAKDCPLVLE